MQIHPNVNDPPDKCMAHNSSGFQNFPHYLCNCDTCMHLISTYSEPASKKLLNARIDQMQKSCKSARKSSTHKFSDEAKAILAISVGRPLWHSDAKCQDHRPRTSVTASPAPPMSAHAQVLPSQVEASLSQGEVPLVISFISPEVPLRVILNPLPGPSETHNPVEHIPPSDDDGSSASSDSDSSSSASDDVIRN